jgi:hypothetical protein
MLKLARQGALSKPRRRRRQGPTCIREQVNNRPRSIGERDGAELDRTGSRPTWPVLGSVRAPFALGARLFMASASAGRHIHPFIREPPTRGEAPGGRRRPPQVLKLPRRWPRTCPSRHGGVPEPMP